MTSLAGSLRFKTVSDEPDDAGADHEVPVDLVELHEILEMAAAVDHEQHDWPQP